MRVVAIITEPLVVKKILKHLNLWYPQAHSPPVNEDTPINHEKVFEDSTYDYSFFDSLPS